MRSTPPLCTVRFATVLMTSDGCGGLVTGHRSVAHSLSDRTAMPPVQCPWSSAATIVRPIEWWLAHRVACLLCVSVGWTERRSERRLESSPKPKRSASRRADRSPPGLAAVSKERTKRKGRNEEESPLHRLRLAADARTDRMTREWADAASAAPHRSTAVGMGQPDGSTARGSFHLRVEVATRGNGGQN